MQTYGLPAEFKGIMVMNPTNYDTLTLPPLKNVHDTFDPNQRNK